MSGEAVAPFDLLLVEDNEADVMLMQEALRAQAGHVRLGVAQDGPEALAYLRREGEWLQAPQPSLVLLDLNLPRMGGLEVLAEIRADPTLRSVPVIVLSTSETAVDVDRAYSLGANAYLVKPRDFLGLFDLVRRIEQFWMGPARLP